MKKMVLVLAIIMIIIISTSKEETLIIPNESIRIRIIANTNEKIDQYLKLQVKDSVKTNLIELLKIANSIDEVRVILKENLNNIDYTVNEVLMKNNNNINYSINYGYNYFPKKVYKGVEYNEGLYESVVITLGGGDGENFWCVLFPPLCTEEIDNSKMDNIEYKSFIKEILDKYL